MAFSVQDLLDLPVLRAARPEVVAGVDLDRRAVRWLHTSEIYEISPLLKGGEVLLTTGLGLVGVSAEGVRSYVHALAHQGVAALMLELGRTFPSAPAELREAAAEHGLPLVLLHGVVPFIEVTETVHALLVAQDLDGLRRRDRASEALHRALLTGRGLNELLVSVTGLCGTPAGLYALDGRLLAGNDVRGAAGDQPTAPPLLEVEVGTGPWAVLALVDAGRPDLAELATLSATAVGICLSQRGQTGPGRRGAGADLLRDLASGRYLSTAEIAERAGLVGFTVRPGHRVVGLAVELTAPTTVRAGLGATAEAARTTLGPALVGDAEGEVLVAASVPPGDLRRRLVELADALDRELGATVGGGVLRVTAGPPVEDVAGLARSLPEARQAAALARSLGLGSRTVVASDLGVYHLLATVVADAALERFVQDQLGPLLEQDARRASELVLTLDTYLEAGLSKTAAAEQLGIRRQTLYSRLERITRLLGGLDLGDRQRRTALDLALVSWRMRSSAASHRTRPEGWD